MQKAKVESAGLGLFLRSLVGLDHEAAKRALAAFIAGKALRGNQIEFLDLVTDHLTEHGCMEPAALYASPYTDISPQGVDGVFTSPQVDELISILDDVRQRAIA